MGLTLSPDVLRKVLAAAARPRTASSTRPPSPPAAADVHHRADDDRPPAWQLVVPVPGLVVVSEANRRDCWQVRRRRAKGQAVAVALAMAGVPRVLLPVRVTFIRIGGKPLDPDNLASSYKAVQDAVAAWLGVDDGDLRRVGWCYRQRPARPGEVRGVEVRIRPLSG